MPTAKEEQGGSTGRPELVRELPLKSVQVREWKAEGEPGIVVDGVACRGETHGERITLAMKHRDGVSSPGRPFEGDH